MLNLTYSDVQHNEPDAINLNKMFYNPLHVQVVLDLIVHKALYR